MPCGRQFPVCQYFKLALALACWIYSKHVLCMLPVLTCWISPEDVCGMQAAGQFHGFKPLMSSSHEQQSFSAKSCPPRAKCWYSLWIWRLFQRSRTAVPPVPSMCRTFLLEGHGGAGCRPWTGISRHGANSTVGICKNTMPYCAANSSRIPCWGRAQTAIRYCIHFEQNKIYHLQKLQPIFFMLERWHHAKSRMVVSLTKSVLEDPIQAGLHLHWAIFAGLRSTAKRQLTGPVEYLIKGPMRSGVGLAKLTWRV